MGAPAACRAQVRLVGLSAPWLRRGAVDRMQVVHSQAGTDADHFAAMPRQQLATMEPCPTLLPWLAPHQESRANNNGLSTSARIPKLVL